MEARAPEQHGPEQPPLLDSFPRRLRWEVPTRGHHVEGEGRVDEEHDDAVVEHPEHVDRVEPLRDAQQREDVGRDLQARREARGARGVVGGGYQSFLLPGAGRSSHLFVPPVHAKENDGQRHEVDAGKGPLRPLEVPAAVSQPREGRVEVDVQRRVAGFGGEFSLGPARARTGTPPGLQAKRPAAKWGKKKRRKLTWRVRCRL